MVKKKTRKLLNSKIILKNSTAKKPKKRKMYFGKDAHNAVSDYQKAETKEERNNIYVDKIKPSFEKLAENLIFIHGFSKGKEHFKILKSDCVTFLYEILEKFDVNRGTKAFSYFNVCAKNYLIIQSKKSMKNAMRNISIDDKNLSSLEKEAIANSQVIPSQEDVIIRKEDKEILKKMIVEIKRKVTNTNEVACINAIQILFEKIEELDFLNKRAIFVYLREISGLNPKQLSVAMSNIRKHYRDMTKSNVEYLLFG